MRDAAAKFALGGLVGGWHLAGDKNNVEVLLHAGLNKILLHVRDPRASALVNARMRYFRDYPDLLKAGRYPKIFTAPMENETFDHRIDNFVRKAVIWLTTWLDAIESCPRLNVLIRSHEELVGDPHYYFASVLDFYSIRPVPLQITSMDETLLFGGSEPGAWRQGISAEQLHRLTAMIPPRLFTHFGWAN
ncbi:MAG: hypothetical protein FJX44_00045 [Alphaproteobacteria bacterium]|nr:hypothetical protein [Alphaproteobacteria bacterium]